MAADSIASARERAGTARRSMRPLLTVLALAFLVRLAFLFALPDLAFLDTSAYLTAGREIFDGKFVSNDIYTPLFPIWAHVMGGGIGLKLADILLSTLTVAIIYELAWTISRSQAASLFAALFAALYPHFAFFAVARLSETLFIFLFCAAFLLLYRRQFSLSCVVLVLAILTRPVLDYLAPCLVALFSLVLYRESAAQTLRRLVVYGAVYAVLMAPWWWHNYQKYGEFVRLSLGDGVVLYSGNNPLNTSGGGVAGGPREDDMNLTVFDHIEDRVERNTAMKQAALQFIKENPGRFIELAATKLVRTWRLWPYAPEFQKPHIIAASILSYGPVLALFLLSLVIVVPRHWRSCLPLLAFIGYLTLVHMVTIGSVRYRLPMEPFAIILAAMALHRLLAGMPVARPMLEWLDSDGRAPTAASS